MEFQTVMPNTELKAQRTKVCKNGPGAAYRSINPLLCPGCDSLVEAHPGSSFFHQAA